MNPEIKDLVLRVHTKVENNSSPKRKSKESSELRLPKWANDALIIDCETTTEELGQKF